MKATGYFTNVVLGKREYLSQALCESIATSPYRKEIQGDGRIRIWGKVGDKWLRVVMLEDGATLHNAFFDRRFKP